MDEEMDAANEEVSPGEASGGEEMVTSETEGRADKGAAETVSGSDDDDDDNDEDDEDVNEAEVKSLEASLSANPYDYSSHVALINKLHTMGELDRLRAARNNMSNVYPLSPELWLVWISDEIKLATTGEQKAEVVELCERAVKDYVSVDVWLEYLQFVIEYMGKDEGRVDEVRQLFDRALTAVGMHVTKGAIIWEAYREYENMILTSLSSLDGDTENGRKKAQLERIVSLFKHQLSIPLLDMDKTHEEYQSWCAKYSAEVDTDEKSILKCYRQSSAKLTSYLPYEEKLVSTQSHSELLDAYKGYLLYIKQNNLDLVTVLYERAITELSLETSIWLDYIAYLENKSRLAHVLDPVYRRASRNIPWCSAVWQKWMRSYEVWDKNISEVQAILESALSAGFSTAEDYRTLWLAYLECMRRRIEQYPDEERDKYLDVIRKTFNRACEHLAKYFGLDGDPNCVILQYWARFEAIHADDMEQMRRLWADILSHGHSATASYWLEYIVLEKSYGDSKHLRKLYQKALGSTQDWPESIANSWIDFERDKGTLEQMEFCEAKTKDKLDKIMAERQKAQQVHSQSESSTQDRKASKRKADDGKWKNLGSSPSKIVKTDVRVRPKLRESFLNVDSKTTNEEEKSKPEVVPPPGYKTTEIKDTDDKDSQPEIDDSITVFVSNLDYTATEDEVRDVLKPVEPITSFRMIKDYKGRSKGYCYVQLSSAEAVKEALKLDRTPIRGRPMYVSKCDPNKSTRSSAFKYSSTLEKKKLFVKGLPLTMTKEELEELFKVYGDLREVRLVTYRNGHSKGLAYVEYHDEATAAKALLNTDGMKIQDKVISVAISQPPDRKKVHQTEENGGQVKSLGGTSTSRTAFGVPKTLLSMVPRNVKASSSNGSAASDGNGQSMSNQDFRNMLLNKK
ncbi:PREDICTED: squamous cell carcinoma antigen recognized by T-cells 3-like [Vollenhovia emeryi]|uniref:squamous cell carcinoma antigen recognized by T-cells 3-like n=1 Tax=Vollenhovia emeryi TaxID=411798 RepID=UPI0005F378C2|nr:PREDICTED: squamous cell carcinoma antigen recognized by T-cells 3-like [Vollenhovia emeryi]